MRILGEICGVEITERKDYEPLIQLLIEDDECWHLKDYVISSHWIDDLISVLVQAKQAIESANAP